ncbi:hypothetical protein ACFL50_03980 [Candidatus Latescibacterota bacterium]
MFNNFKIMFLTIFLLSGCINVPSTEEIDSDIGLLQKEINEATTNVQNYSGGLLAILANVRLETLQSTKAMLEQKKTGIKRYIPVSYIVDGRKYSPPENKDILLQELQHDIEYQKNELANIEKEIEQNGGGLLGILSMTQAATTKNTIAFLEQKRLLLKHDMPYYSYIPDDSENIEPKFKPTPGNDIDKF